MTREELKMLRAWIRAEIAYAITPLGYGSSRDFVDDQFDRVVVHFCTPALDDHPPDECTMFLESFNE